MVITVDELHSGSLDEIRRVRLHRPTRHPPRTTPHRLRRPPSHRSKTPCSPATPPRSCSAAPATTSTASPLRPPALAIAGPIAERGATITPDALAAAVAAHPGTHSWSNSSASTPGKQPQTPPPTHHRRRRRRRRHRSRTPDRRLVFAPTWRTLSDVDRRFLAAMARDRRPVNPRRHRHPTRRRHQLRRRLPPPPHQRRHDHPNRQSRIDFAHHATRHWLRTHPDLNDNPLPRGLAQPPHQRRRRPAQPTESNRQRRHRCSRPRRPHTVPAGPSFCLNESRGIRRDREDHHSGLSGPWARR